MTAVREGLGAATVEQAMHITSRTRLTDIAAALRADGFPPDMAVQVKAAALNGTLLWTQHRLVTTDSSRISEHPRGDQ